MPLRCLRAVLLLIWVWVIVPGLGGGQLISYWPLDGDLLDGAPDGEKVDSGTMIGPGDFTAGLHGEGLQLDGTSHVLFEESPDLQLVGEVSVALWFRVDAWDRAEQTLFAGGRGRRFHLQRFEDSEEALGFRSGREMISGGSVNDGEWHHVLAVSRDDWGTKLFVDGKQVAVGDKPHAIASETVLLGANPGKEGVEWHGVVDDVGVFGRALNDYEASAVVELATNPDFHYSLEQMAALFAAHREQTAAIIGTEYWSFVERVDNATGGTIRLADDRSGMAVRLTPRVEPLAASSEIPETGEPVVLRWRAVNAESLTLFPGEQKLSTEQTEGSVTVYPEGPVTYTLMARNAHGSDLAQITLYTGMERPVLQLSELMADPAGEHPDGEGLHTDWIEIYNPGPIAVRTAGYFLTDDSEDPKKWALPDVRLDPRAYRTIFASGRESAPTEGEWHANFKLSKGGETVALFYQGDDGALSLSREIKFPKQRRGISYGLSGLGTELGYLDSPTPGTPNPPRACKGFARGVFFSRSRGFAEEPFSLELETATPAGEIWYTTDGSRPEPASAMRYDSPITVDRTMIVRAVARSENMVPSAMATHSYLFAKQMAHQGSTPPGWPQSWGDVEADYEMDPDIVSTPRFKGTIASGFRGLPVISLSAREDALFGPSGIYAHPQESGVDWERPCSIEMMYPNGRSFQADCGIRIQGGASRSPRIRKHSFRLLFKKTYGPAWLEQRLFPDREAADRFDTVILRAGFNDGWVRSNSNDLKPAQYIRDELMRRTQRDMGHASARGIFVHVVLNGLYWGVYNLVERPSAPFAASYLGGEKSDWDALNSGKVIDGDEVAWKALYQLLGSGGMLKVERYEGIKQWVDLENLIDYLILNYYGANGDWDHHNWYAARRRGEGEGLKFFSWDAEFSFHDLRAERIHTSDGERPTAIHAALVKNPDYKMLFADRIYKHLEGDGALSPGKMVARYRQLGEEVEAAMVCESARWGDVAVEEPFTVEDWRVERDRLLNSYLPRRTAIVLRQFVRRGLYPKLGPPTLQRREGSELSLDFTVEDGGEVWFTTDGSDPRLSGGDPNPAAESATTARLSSGKVLKVRARQGETWSVLVSYEPESNVEDR